MTDPNKYSMIDQLKKYGPLRSDMGYTVVLLSPLADEVPDALGELSFEADPMKDFNLYWGYADKVFKVSIATGIQHSPRFGPYGIITKSGAYFEPADSDRNIPTFNIATEVLDVTKQSLISTLGFLQTWVDLNSSDTRSLTDIRLGGQIVDHEICAGIDMSTKSVRELGGEIFAALMKEVRLRNQQDCLLPVDSVVDLVMKVLARNSGRTIINDPDLPVDPT